MRRMVLWDTACNFNTFISNQSIFNCLIIGASTLNCVFIRGKTHQLFSLIVGRPENLIDFSEFEHFDANHKAGMERGYSVSCRE